MTTKPTSVRVEPGDIKARLDGAKKQSAPVGKNFDAFLGAVDAMAPFGSELTYNMTGSPSAASVLHGAFTGFTGAAGAYGYGQGSGSGLGSGVSGFGAYSEYPGVMGVGKYQNPGGQLPGDPGAYTGDLISSMNQNNLKLLELQAVMQSNMQAWNTKSNILSADHRARMAMIEKFTARA